MRRKFSLYVLAVIVAAFSLAIAGCGDDDGGGGGGGDETSRATSRSAASGPARRRGRSTPCWTASNRRTRT